MKLVYDEEYKCFRFFNNDSEIEIYLSGTICDVSTNYPMSGDLFSDYNYGFILINKLKCVYKRIFGL